MTDTDQTTLRPGDFTGEWDPDMMRRMVTLSRPVCKRWFRAEVRGFETFPSGAALIVSNHSGLPFAWDMPVFWVGFFEKFGYDRRLYFLAHDILSRTPATGPLMRMGMLRASRDNADKALRSGAALVVFPGAAHDAARPTWEMTTVDFGGRTGYVTMAIEAGVPIVPAVSIGGQETQLYLTRGTWLAKLAGAETPGAPRGNAGLVWLPVRAECRNSEPAASFQDRHPGAAADRHHRPVRRKS